MPYNFNPRPARLQRPQMGGQQLPLPPGQSPPPSPSKGGMTGEMPDPRLQGGTPAPQFQPPQQGSYPPRQVGGGPQGGPDPYRQPTGLPQGGPTRLPPQPLPAAQAPKPLSPFDERLNQIQSSIASRWSGR